jgi:hypothetical protein
MGRIAWFDEVEKVCTGAMQGGERWVACVHIATLALRCLG